MRVNIYAEEMTHRSEIITKDVDGITFTGLRIFLELPVTVPLTDNGNHRGYTQHKGPFMHKPGDDDSSAVTFWGKSDFRDVLRIALAKLDEHYELRGASKQNLEKRASFATNHPYPLGKPQGD